MIPSSLRVLFVGNFQGPGNATGEEPDERHMARCLQQTGVHVVTVPRDEVHAFWKGAKDNNLPAPEPFDTILVAKWGHYTPEMMDMLKERYKGKLVYFVWDFMFATHRDMWTADWHRMMLKKCDLYLSGELGMADWFKKEGINYQYFNWDSADGQYDQLPRDEKYDVVFTGTYIGHSYRNAILKAIHERFDLTVFSFDFEEWRKQGFKAEPGKYGADYNQLSAQSKVMLCLNWVEPRKETHGYWSNRIGKVTTTGGLPVVHYVPGMERVFSDNVTYFYGGDLFEKVKWLLDNPTQRETYRTKAYDFGRRTMTTQVRMRDLRILLEGYVGR